MSSSRLDLRTCSGGRRRMGIALAVLALAATTAAAQADPPRSGEPAASAAAPSAKLQGVAVIATGASRDEAFTLARAVYASSLRPRGLDELRARVLAGDPPPPAATKEVRELAELRAAVTSDDAASRQLLGTIARQTGVQALLVVSSARAPSSDAGDVDDGGAAPVSSARLFLTETGELDAARYEPDASGWRATVASLVARFPPTVALERRPLPVAPKVTPAGEDRPFYKSPWLWAAVGGAALLGGLFFFAGQDTGDDPIHLRMRVPER